MSAINHLAQIADDECLTRTGRSIGILASGHVMAAVLDALPALLRADTDAGAGLRDRLGLEWESVQWCACADAPASHQCIRDGHVLGLPRRRLVGRWEDQP